MQKLTIITVKIERGEVKATFRLPADIMKLKYISIDKNTSVNSLVIQVLTDMLKKRQQVLERDNYTCQKCSCSAAEWRL